MSGAAAAIVVDLGRRVRVPAETVDRIELRRGEAVDVGGDPAQAERRWGAAAREIDDLVVGIGRADAVAGEVLHDFCKIRDGAQSILFGPEKDRVHTRRRKPRRTSTQNGVA